jgi:hypothetical protein
MMGAAEREKENFVSWSAGAGGLPGRALMLLLEQ